MEKKTNKTTKRDKIAEEIGNVEEGKRKGQKNAKDTQVTIENEVFEKRSRNGERGWMDGWKMGKGDARKRALLFDPFSAIFPFGWSEGRRKRARWATITFRLHVKYCLNV